MTAAAKCQHCAEPISFDRDHGLWLVRTEAVLDGVCKQAPEVYSAALGDWFAGGHEPQMAAPSAHDRTEPTMLGVIEASTARAELLPSTPGDLPLIRIGPVTFEGDREDLLELVAAVALEAWKIPTSDLRAAAVAEVLADKIGAQARLNAT